MDYSNSPGTEVMIGIYHTSSEAAVLKLWDHIKCLVNTCSEKIKLILSRFEVIKDLSVFSKKFEDPSDFLLV